MKNKKMNSTTKDKVMVPTNSHHERGMDNFHILEDLSEDDVGNMVIGKKFH